VSRAWRNRNHPAWWAFIVHRVSGLLLAAFIPLHFWALGQALAGEAALDGFIAWTDSPLVKIAEFGLVVALAAHLGGGMRLLMLEFLPWRDWQKSLFALSVAASIGAGLLFALNIG
jgi:fumarate reductase subunit D